MLNKNPFESSYFISCKFSFLLIENFTNVIDILKYGFGKKIKISQSMQYEPIVKSSRKRKTRRY